MVIGKSGAGLRNKPIYPQPAFSTVAQKPQFSHYLSIITKALQELNSDKIITYLGKVIFAGKVMF